MEEAVVYGITGELGVGSWEPEASEGDCVRIDGVFFVWLSGDHGWLSVRETQGGGEKFTAWWEWMEVADWWDRRTGRPKTDPPRKALRVGHPGDLWIGRGDLHCGGLFGFGHGEDAGHYDGEAEPIGGVLEELFAAAFGDGIKLGSAIVVGSAPFGGNPAALLKANERGINGALVEEDFVAGDLFDAASDAVTVLGAHGVKCLQDHQVQGALKKIEFGVRHEASCVVTTGE